MWEKLLQVLGFGHETLVHAVGKTILIIDDVEVDRKIIASALEKKGYQVQTATSGESGLKTAESHHPDLIFLDVGLPDIKGPDVCKRLKGNERTKDIPVIFLTGENTPKNVIESYEVGAEYYLSKPICSKALVKSVEETFKEREG